MFDIATLNQVREQARANGSLTSGLDEEIDNQISMVGGKASEAARQLKDRLGNLELKRDEIIESLTNMKFDLDCVTAPLHIAAKFGLVEVAKALLDRGAAVNMPCMVGDMAQYNATPYAMGLSYYALSCRCSKN